MSDPHDHQPDPAALDELQRAFGGGVDDAEEPATEQPGDRPAADEDPSGDPDGPLGSPRTGGDAAEPNEVHDETPPADSEDVADDATDRRREVLSALGIDDDVIDDPDPAVSADEPAEVFIVEQEPLVDPTPTPLTPPAVIRIDDYGGSVVVDAPPPDTPDPPASTGTAALPDDDRPVVIGIDDEDLPDAAYVEGDLDGSGARRTVFIDDDNTGDAIAPEIDRDVRRGIEPRLRERRAAVKRALGRKRLRWLLLGTVVVIVGVGVLAVLGSGLFAIQEDNVTVTGVVYADSDRVDAVVDDLVGTPALLVDIQAAEDELESIPWVDQARVRVSFPHTATIEIRERAAMATYQGPDQRYRVLDRDGRVLAVLDGYPIAYVLITGPDPVDLDSGQFTPQGYAAASELAKNLTDSIRGRVERIDVTADGSRLILFLDDGTEVRFGAARDLFNKQLRLEAALANNPEREPGVIDVSTSEVTL